MGESSQANVNTEEALGPHYQNALSPSPSEANLAPFAIKALMF